MRATLLASLVALFACAPNPHDAYRDAHPGWAVAFPHAGIDLDETVASIWAPATSGWERVVTDVRILRLDEQPWRPIPLAELRSRAHVPTEEGDYAVVAHVWCRSNHRPPTGPVKSPVPAEKHRYEQERTSWYVLPGNRLRYWDHNDFVEVCGSFNSFVPAAAGEHAERERELVGWIEAQVASPRDLEGHLYLKGLRLMTAGRSEDALALFRRAEGQLEFPLNYHAKWIDEHGRVEYSSPEGVPRLREKLRDALVRAGVLTAARPETR